MQGKRKYERIRDFLSCLTLIDKFNKVVKEVIVKLKLKIIARIFNVITSDTVNHLLTRLIKKIVCIKQEEIELNRKVNNSCLKRMLDIDLFI